MSKTARQETVEALTEQLKGSPNIFVTDFTRPERAPDDGAASAPPGARASTTWW